MSNETSDIYFEICLTNIYKFAEMLMEINYKEGFLSWYNSANHFIEEYGNVILLTVNFIMILWYFSRHKFQRHQLIEGIRVERRSLREKSAAIDRKLIDNSEMKERLASFQKQYDSQTAMKEEIQQLDEKIKILSDLSTTWQQSHIDVLQRHISDMERKMKDIELIIIDWLYNDSKYLAYEGDEWTFTALARKGDEIGIPSLTWGSKEALSYTLRAVEHLTKIGNIVELDYPDLHNTEERPGSQVDEKRRKKKYDEEESDDEEYNDFLAILNGYPRIQNTENK